MPSNKSQQSGKDAKTNSTRGRNKGSSTTGKIDLTSLTSNMRGKSATRTACFVDGSNVLVVADDSEVVCALVVEDADDAGDGSLVLVAASSRVQQPVVLLNADTGR